MQSDEPAAISWLHEIARADHAYPPPPLDFN